MDLNGGLTQCVDFVQAAQLAQCTKRLIQVPRDQRRIIFAIENELSKAVVGILIIPIVVKLLITRTVRAAGYIRRNGKPSKVDDDCQKQSAG